MNSIWGRLLYWRASKFSFGFNRWCFNFWKYMNSFWILIRSSLWVSKWVLRADNRDRVYERRRLHLNREKEDPILHRHMNHSTTNLFSIRDHEWIFILTIAFPSYPCLISTNESSWNTWRRRTLKIFNIYLSLRSYPLTFLGFAPFPFFFALEYCFENIKNCVALKPPGIFITVRWALQIIKKKQGYQPSGFPIADAQNDSSAIRVPLKICTLKKENYN